MRESCRLLEIVHNELADIIKPGISTLDIDRYGEKRIRSLGGIPNFKNYNGYPASICVSVNDEVVHGIPNKHRILQEGDIVSLDAGLIYKGYHSDAARTYGVGQVSPEAQKLSRNRAFLRGSSLQKLEIICMIFPMLLEIMPRALAMAWFAILLVTALVPVFMKIRRFPTFRREVKASDFSLV